MITGHGSTLLPPPTYFPPRRDLFLLHFFGLQRFCHSRPSWQNVTSRNTVWLFSLLSLSLMLVLGPGILIHCNNWFHRTWRDPQCSHTAPLPQQLQEDSTVGTSWQLAYLLRFYADGLWTYVCLWTVGGCQGNPGNSIQAHSFHYSQTSSWAVSIILRTDVFLFYYLKKHA